MKSQYLSSALTLLFLSLFACGFSQDLDLIVTTKGDSIACRIDSISETHIYFEMKSHGNWIHTHMGITEATHNEQRVINSKQYLFKSGTSIIESVYTGELPRNSIYAGIFSLNYARTFLGNSFGITLGGGVFYYYYKGILLESSLLFGISRHFLEPGIMGIYFFGVHSDNPESDGNYSLAGITIRLGYRYQGKKDSCSGPHLIYFLLKEMSYYYQPYPLVTHFKIIIQTVGNRAEI